MPMMSLPKVLLKSLDLTIETPRLEPAAMEMPNPIRIRLKLINMAIMKVRFLNPSTIVLNTLTGDGNMYSGQILSVNKNCHNDNKIK